MTNVDGRQIYQSSTQILGLLEQAERSRGGLRVDAYGAVKIANFGTKVAEFFEGLGKSADWKADRRRAVSQAVFEKLSQAVERELNDKTSSVRDGKVAFEIIGNVFGSGEFRNIVNNGLLPSAANFRRALADAEAAGKASIDEKEHTLNNKTRAMLKDGRMDAIIVSFLQDNNGSSDIRVGLAKRLEAMYGEFEKLQKAYADNPNPSDDEAALIRDFANDIIDLEERITKALKENREIHAENWVGQDVAVPVLAMDRSSYSTRGDFRRQVEGCITRLSELNASLESNPAYKAMSDVVENFLEKALEMGEVNNTTKQNEMYFVALDAKAEVVLAYCDLAFGSQDKSNDHPDALKMKEEFSKLVHILESDAAQQVRFAPESALQVETVPGNDHGRFGIAHGYRSAQSQTTVQQADAYLAQAKSYTSPEGSATEYDPISHRRKQGVGDYGNSQYRAERMADVNAQWNEKLDAEPKADRSEFKPSDERFVRGDTSELNNSANDYAEPAPDIVADHSDAPAKSNLRRT